MSAVNVHLPPPVVSVSGPMGTRLELELCPNGVSVKAIDGMAGRGSATAPGLRIEDLRLAIDRAAKLHDQEYGS